MEKTVFKGNGITDAAMRDLNRKIDGSILADIAGRYVHSSFDTLLEMSGECPEKIINTIREVLNDEQCRDIIKMDITPMLWFGGYMNKEDEMQDGDFNHFIMLANLALSVLEGQLKR